MRHPWFEFQISLSSLKSWLDDRYPDTNGIIADDTGFEIVERKPLSEMQKLEILVYLNNLTPEEEDAKLSRPALLQAAILLAKQDMVAAPIEQFSIPQKKILLALPLSTQEEDDLITTYKRNYK